jgi:hypothetical protein
MREPTYSHALLRSWRFVWHNKITWIFGLLALLIGQFGLNHFIGQLILLGTGNQSTLSFFSWPSSWPVWQISTVEGGFLFAWLVVIMLALGILTVVVAILSQGALIAAVADYFKNETSPRLARAWHKSVRRFWPLLVLNVLQKIISGALWMLTFFILGSLHAETVPGFLGTIVVISVSGLLMLAVTAVTIYAAGYIVEYNFPLLAGIVEGFRLFSEHLLVTLELSILLVLCTLVLWAVVYMGSLLILVPAWFIWVAAGFTGSLGLFAVGFVVELFLFAVMLAIVGAIFNAFMTSAWMYFFMRMHHQGLGSRIFNLVERVVRTN